MSQSSPLPVVSLIDGQPMTLSTDVATYFRKRHFHVLRDIDRILSRCPAERATNFGGTFMEVPGPHGAVRRERAYRLTKDGFIFLAMGFTGPEADEWKWNYINAFNAMEAELRRRVEEERKALRMPDDLAFEAGQLAVAFARLTPERVRVIREVLFWRAAGNTCAETARMAHVSRGTARYIIRRYYHDHISQTLYALDNLHRRALA